MSVLGRKPQTIDALAEKINRQFKDVDIRTIVNDAREFYSMLERDGFIVSGDTPQECNEKDKRFSYKTLTHEIIKDDFSPIIAHQEKSTPDFFEEYFNGKPQLTSLHIEITSKCNERCMHCYIPHENKLSSIEPDLFYDILKQCRDMRVLHVTLSGGEPMLHKNFCAFLKKCREYDFSVNVLSNLTLLSDEIITEMKRNPLLGVQTSLYSMNSNIHDDITQMRGSFEKTKNAILKLIENDIPLQINCPIIKQNKNCYNDVIKWGQKYNIYVGNDYAIIAKYNHTTQNLNCRLSIDEIEEIMNDKIANDEKYLEQMRVVAEKKKNNAPGDFVCSVCRSLICIAENGDVYPCVGWHYVVGNVNEASLNDIWNNSEKVRYLRELRNRDFPKCVQCPDKDFCTICMVRNGNENPLGDPLSANEYFCDIAKLNRKIMLKREEKTY